MVDFDGDGKLDLILSHGESMAQPLSVFKVNEVPLLMCLKSNLYVNKHESPSSVP